MKKVCFLYRKIKFFILCVLLSSALQAQSVEPKFDELIVGIPNCVLQDKNGFIWIGAQEGLLRYDGNELKKYHNIPFDSTSISGDWVTAFAEDNKKNLWVATMNGLNYFDQGTEQFVHFNVVNKNDSSLTSISISKMIVNDDGSMWIATFNNGFYKMHIENESFQKIYSPLEEPYRVENASIWYMIISGTGYLWLGPLGKDLILFDTATYHSKIIEFASSSSEGARISTMIEDKDGILWIGTINSGLFKIQLTNKEVKIVNHYLNNQRNQDSLSYNNICDIIKPSVVDTNALWIGTASGINTLDLKTNSLTLNCFAYKKSDLVMVILGMI